MIVLISPCFKGALTSSCTFACAWCVCWTCVTSLLPSHYQALLWPSQTNQPLECTRVVANVSFLWTWESMSQGSWCAWDTVGRWHCSVWQWSGCTRLPVVWHCESEPQADILERHYMLIIKTVNICTNVAWFSDGLRISCSHKGVRATDILGPSEDKASANEVQYVKNFFRGPGSRGHLRLCFITVTWIQTQNFVITLGCALKITELPC